MKVYFVRHGQSILNAAHTHQHPDTPLSSLGKEQAKFVASRFKSIPIEKIYSSDLMRAKQTAEAIAEEIKKPLVLSELLRERKRPTEVLGMEYTNSKAKKITNQIEENLEDKNWHYSDEENFSDLVMRTQDFLRVLKKEAAMDSENIAVVSHGAMLKLIILSMILRDSLSPKIFQSFNENVRVTNTGITMMEFNNGNWRLLTFNDYAHLGE